MAADEQNMVPKAVQVNTYGSQGPGAIAYPAAAVNTTSPGNEIGVVLYEQKVSWFSRRNYTRNSRK